MLVSQYAVDDLACLASEELVDRYDAVFVLRRRVVCLDGFESAALKSFHLADAGCRCRGEDWCTVGEVAKREALVDRDEHFDSEPVVSQLAEKVRG